MEYSGFTSHRPKVSTGAGSRSLHGGGNAHFESVGPGVPKLRVIDLGSRSGWGPHRRKWDCMSGRAGEADELPDLERRQR